jgi:hypothetical protein
MCVIIKFLFHTTFCVKTLFRLVKWKQRPSVGEAAQAARAREEE